MAAAADVHPRAPILLSFSANLAIALSAVFVGYAVMLYFGAGNPSLHTIFDTSTVVIAVLAALLLWDVSRRTGESWLLFLTISFAMAALGDLYHLAVVLGTLDLEPTSVELRTGTWGPSAYVLPIGLGASLLLRDRPRSFAWPFALGLALVAAVLVVVFHLVPRCSEPGFLGIS